jgi:NarL family two-component system response regulator LiaR
MWGGGDATDVAHARVLTNGPSPRRRRLTTLGAMTASDKIRVLIVDDHAIVRRGLRGLLEIVDDMEVIGDAADGEQAVRQADSGAPDVVLMDLVMPVKDGIAATREIKSRRPATEIVALTSFIDDDKVVAALEAGAAGYLLKDADERAVIDAIRAARDGEVRLDPAVAKVLAERLRRRPAARPVDPLTARELDVLRLLGRGLSNKEIAAELGIADCTARTHVSNVLGKLDLASRTQAALFALEHGFVAEPAAAPKG